LPWAASAGIAAPRREEAGPGRGLIHQQEQEREIAEQERFRKTSPARDPTDAGYESQRWQSARLVGGDYFDILPSTRKCWESASPSAAGKDARALLMSNLQGLAPTSSLSCAESSLQPADSIVYRNTDSDRSYFSMRNWMPMRA